MSATASNEDQPGALLQTNQNRPLHLRILQINDVYELDNLPHFCTLVRHYQNQNNHPSLDAPPDQTLVVLAGDFLSPSLLSALDQGRSMVDVLNMCGVTHVCLGNHEADIEPTQLAQRIRHSNFVWLNTNVRDLDTKLDVTTLPHDVVLVQRGGSNINNVKRVGLLGLLTEDPGLYRPGAFAGATISPLLTTTETYLRDTMQSLDVDLVVPLTHQSMTDDRLFAHHFSGQVFPIVVGGHDHEPYDETHNESRILKTGCDATHVAVIDVFWDISTDDGIGSAAQPEIHVELVPTTTFDADPDVQSRVDCYRRVLVELERAKLFRFENWMSPTEVFSTVNNRLGYSTGSKVLTSILRRGMRAQCALMNAGGIRGNATYDGREWFTWSDLKSELPFPAELIAVELPGHVLQDAILYSRQGARQSPPVSSGGYLHTCDALEFANDDASDRIVSIQGQPFDLQKQYLCALPYQVFEGVDNQIPLLDWAQQQQSDLPSSERARPAKLVIVEMFAALLWLEMGSFADIDTNRDGVLTLEEIKSRVGTLFGEQVADLVAESVMDVADLSRTGTITPLDMAVVQFIATDMLNHVCTREELRVMEAVVSEVLGMRPTHEMVKRVVSELRSVLDLTGDGRINRDEAMQALGEIKRRSLLT